MNSELNQTDIDVVCNDFVFNDILVQIPDVELAPYLFHSPNYPLISPQISPKSIEFNQSTGYSPTKSPQYSQSPDSTTENWSGVNDNDENILYDFMSSLLIETQSQNQCTSMNKRAQKLKRLNENRRFSY